MVDSLNKYLWRLKENHTDSYRQFYSLARKIVYGRGFEEEVAQFLNPSLASLHDPFLLSDMDTAVNRITQAVTAKQRIVVYGDYDVDGITSIAVLKKVLATLGCDIDYYIPDRMKEGYGVNLAAIKSLCADYDLLITVDCGITSCSEVEYAMENGLDVIVTDHHLPAEKIPPAVAVVNPKRHDDCYPNSELAGVGVVFKVCQALLTSYYGQQKATEIMSGHLVLTAIGTVADIVPLIGENRTIVSLGLRNINKSVSLAGLNALINISKIAGQEITCSHIGYRIAPRLNAGGRLGTAGNSLEILLTDNDERAVELAVQLDNLNEKRRNIEKRIETEAIAMLENERNSNKNFIMLYKEDWHHGVLGIVASKLVEKYYRPVILLGQEQELIKGSGRSIECVHLHQLLSNYSELLSGFGGHFMAAGLSLPPENMAVLHQKLSQDIASSCSTEDLLPKISADIEATLPEINNFTVQELKKLKPFGIGNPTPKILFKGVEVKQVLPIGQQKHTKLVLRQHDRQIDCLFWQRPDLGVAEGEVVDIIGTVEENSWRDKITLNIIGKAIRRNGFGELADHRGLKNKDSYISKFFTDQYSSAILFFGKKYGRFKEYIENDVRPLGSGLILYYNNDSFTVVNSLEGLKCQHIFCYDIPFNRQQLFRANVGEDICLHLLYNKIDSLQQLETVARRKLDRKNFSDFYRFLAGEKKNKLNIADYKIQGKAEDESGVLALTMLQIFSQLGFLTWKVNEIDEIYYQLNSFKSKVELNTSAAYLNYLTLIDRASTEHSFLLSSGTSIQQYYLRGTK